MVIVNTPIGNGNSCYLNCIGTLESIIILIIGTIILFTALYVIDKYYKK